MYEISSDSDEEWYDRDPKKLEKLRTKHGLNDFNVNSIEDKQLDTIGVSLVSWQDSEVIEVLDDGSTNLISKEVDPPISGVLTRSRRSKRKNSDVITDVSTLSPVASPQKSAKRGRGREKDSQPAPSTRSRGRGRGRRGRAQNIDSDLMTPIPSTPVLRRGSRRRGSQRYPRVSNSIITYSVGNTDDYPDASDNQLLFNHKNVPEPTITDLDDSLQNEELSVKVLWQHLDVFKFNIRRYQKLTQIFDFFVKEKDVSRDRLLFTYHNGLKDHVIRPDDTPDSIEYNIAKFIEGGITNRQIVLNKSDSAKKKGFVVKFQCQNKKKTFEVTIGKDDKLQLAMVKFAEHLEIPITNLVFEFDGETIHGKSTPKDLDIESGDCIDVKIINVNK